MGKWGTRITWYCECCNAPRTTKPSGKQRFCSNKCSAKVLRPPLERLTATCLQCDVQYTWFKNNRKVGKYCSRACFFMMKKLRGEARERAEAERRKQPKYCVSCDTALNGRRTRCSECTRQRNAIIARDKYRSEHKDIKPRRFTCPECGTTFTAIARSLHKTRFCSRRCCKLWHGANKKSGGLYKGFTQLPKPMQKTLIALRKFNQMKYNLARYGREKV